MLQYMEKGWKKVNHSPSIEFPSAIVIHENILQDHFPSKDMVCWSYPRQFPATCGNQHVPWSIPALDVLVPLSMEVSIAWAP